MLRHTLPALLMLAAPLLAADKPPAGPEKGFDAKRDKIAHGTVEPLEYDSKTVGEKRKAVVYLPPGYSKDKDAKYPVLYLLHGIGDVEDDWVKKGAADHILDNLIADKKAVPMVVVMPNGRAAKNMTPKTPWGEQTPAFAKFEDDLLKDLMPVVEKKYAVKADRENRAIAGLSMGGGQALNFGLTHLDTFAWVGGFAPAPITKPVKELIKDPDATTKKLKLLWLSCGDEDFILDVSKKTHAGLDEAKVPHVWHLGKGKHEWAVWKDDLYRVAQLLFAEKK
jgi:enterochelin esterase-like enzyme